MNPKASTVKKLFSRETSVSIDIKAKPAAIWARLTDAAGFPQWNSTVVSIEGDIKLGETIRLRAKLDPKRVFKLKVKALQPEKTMTWGDAMGSRIYELTERGDGTTTFSMREKIGGPFFPLFARMIPPFDATFEQYAADLKAAVERA